MSYSMIVNTSNVVPLLKCVEAVNGIIHLSIFGPFNEKPIPKSLLIERVAVSILACVALYHSKQYPKIAALVVILEPAICTAYTTWSYNEKGWGQKSFKVLEGRVIFAVAAVITLWGINYLKLNR